YYREGRSVRQTAELLGIGEDAVKQRLARARSRVRDLMPDGAGRTLSRTAPGAAFVAGVSIALSAATPGVAAAAAIGLGKTTAGASLLAKLGVTSVTAGAFAGMLGGLAGGLTAVFSGARKLHREARDDEERRGVRTYAYSASTLVVAFLATLLLFPQRVPVTIMFVAMFGGICWLCFAFVPRVTARRKAAELLEDPAA